jgi:hypothetical protein
MGRPPTGRALISFDILSKGRPGKQLISQFIPHFPRARVYRIPKFGRERRLHSAPLFSVGVPTADGHQIGSAMSVAMRQPSGVRTTASTVLRKVFTLKGNFFFLAMTSPLRD